MMGILGLSSEKAQHLLSGNTQPYSGARPDTGPNHPSRYDAKDGYSENNPHTATVPLRTA